MPEPHPPEPHRPDLALYKRGCELQARQDLEAAITCYTEALAINPNLAQAWSNRGVAFTAMNRCDEALVSLDRAIDLVPDYPEAHFSRAITLLLKGELLAGWSEFEWRWQTGPGRKLRDAKTFTQPQWRGEGAVAGKTILLYCERGLGDTLQFCRYAQQVAQLGARVILQVQEPLVALLRGTPGNIQVISESAALPPFDLQCPLLSLPMVFRTSLSTIPAMRGYLRADAGKVLHLRARLARRQVCDAPTPRVGLMWRGDAGNPDDVHRSLALRDLLPFLPPARRYFSLQKEITREEQALIDSHPCFDAPLRELDFAMTAALCECLDLVIAVDTSIAHLAAGLAVRTWIMLPFNPDCRWLLERDDSPWYPSVKLYRQTRRGDWRGVLERLGADLGRVSLRA